MLDKLNEIEKTALEALDAITDSATLDTWRVANVGRSWENSPRRSGQLSVRRRTV